MDAVVVDLKDMSVRTPEQVIRVFYGLYDGAEVREKLFRIYALLSVSEKNGMPVLKGHEKQVIRLFDQLVFLTEAIEKLRLGMTEATSCAICGGDKTLPDRGA